MLPFANRKTMMISAIVVLAAGCGPEAGDDDIPPGTLEYDHPIAQYYRLDRRVDVVAVDSTLSREGCGFLTERAYEDLVGTIEALDPNVDYGWAECFPEYDPEGLVHLEGFMYSPFLCEWYCCHPDLIRVATVYFVVGSNLYDQEPNIDGEPYVALEPDMPCPE